jgi:hypothetical protein
MAKLRFLAVAYIFSALVALCLYFTAVSVDIHVEVSDGETSTERSSNSNHEFFDSDSKKGLRTNSWHECETWSCLVGNAGFTEASLEWLSIEVMHPFSTWFLSECYFIGGGSDEFKDEFGLSRSSFRNKAGTVPAHSPVKDCAKLSNITVLFVQNNEWNQFIRSCIPALSSPIILVTGQWHLPQIHPDRDSESILANPNIIHWFSQNPIYNHEKYTAIPYGILREMLPSFSRAVWDSRNESKSVNVQHLGMKMTHPERKKLPAAATLEAGLYLREIAKSYFMISPMGDRPDSYRHWESIGLNTVPICNCPDRYKQLFGDRMLFMQIDEMVEVIQQHREIKRESLELDRDILSTGFWASKIAYIKEDFVATL